MNVRSVQLLLILLPAAFLVGCGAEPYERRFQHNTITFFEDQAELNTNLGPAWSAQGIQLRLPAGFESSPLPAEKPIAVELPSGKEVTFPGVIGLFTGKIGAITADGGTLEVPATIAILSNRPLFKASGSQQGEKKPIDPKKFVDIVTGELTANASSRPVEKKSYSAGGEDFQPTVRYSQNRYRIMGRQGIGYQMTSYLHTAQDDKTKVVVLVMAPRELARDAELAIQIPLSLRTLRVTKPGAGRIPGAGGAATAGGGATSPRF